MYHRFKGYGFTEKKEDEVPEISSSFFFIAARKRIDRQ
jgi:hypothetical protein